MGNTIRQLQRFAEGSRLSSKERYWKWAGYASEQTVLQLFSGASQQQFQEQEYHLFKRDLLSTMPSRENMNDVLNTDMQFVLPTDMLTKVDLMSMAHGLEVRTPFLDVDVVSFLFSLPGGYKIDGSMRKRVLQDAFSSMIPSQLYNRPKKGFEVPMLKWFQNEMKSLITDDLLSERFVRDQNIFNYEEIKKLKQKLFSSNPDDVHARIWALVVFQWWWKKHCA